ncbi:MAG: hypothetical protein GXP45_06385 [bacterium]|nr:hypothetical protein [bacterium]
MREDKKFAEDINKLYKPVYEAFGYELIPVPKFLADKDKSIKRRVKFILDRT